MNSQPTCGPLDISFSSSTDAASVSSVSPPPWLDCFMRYSSEAVGRLLTGLHWSSLEMTQGFFWLAVTCRAQRSSVSYVAVSFWSYTVKPSLSSCGWTHTVGQEVISNSITLKLLKFIPLMKVVIILQHCKLVTCSEFAGSNSSHARFAINAHRADAPPWWCGSCSSLVQVHTGLCCTEGTCLVESHLQQVKINK